MTGAEQRERGKAYEKIQKQLDELSIEIHNAWEVEVEARQEATRLLGLSMASESNRMESLFARMLDEETQFRKQHIANAMVTLERTSTMRSEAVQLTVYAYLKMPWWKRWGWMVFGYSFLEWIYRGPAPLDPREAQARQEAGKAPMSQENLRKQQSYSERPQ